MSLDEPVSTPLDVTQEGIPFASIFPPLAELHGREGKVGNSEGQGMGSLQVVCKEQHGGQGIRAKGFV